VFFTDAFDLDKPYDNTRNSAKKIIKIAQGNPQYDTQEMSDCVCTDWRQRKDKILDILDAFNNDDVLKSIGPEEYQYFKEKSNAVIDPLLSDSTAISLSK
jgi:hypothetical protein